MRQVALRGEAHRERHIHGRHVSVPQELFGAFDPASEHVLMRRLSDGRLEGTREIDLATTLKPYGLVIERIATHSSRPRIAVAPKLSAKQRALIAQLGNDSR